MKSLPCGLVVLGVLAWIGNVRADVTPAPYFQDHTVLQRDRPVPVWGKARAGERVTVSFAGQSVSAVADAKGRWQVRLAALAADASPRELRIQGDNTITLQDVVVGEVWLASGQSNMEYKLIETYDADLETATARFPLVRELKIKRTRADAPAETVEATWRRAISAEVAEFSAVGYPFARSVHLALDVPVGVISCAWGGSPIEAWLSAETLASDPAFAPVAERWAATMAEFPAKDAAYKIALKEWETAKAEAAKKGESFTLRRPTRPNGPGTQHEPSVLFNGMFSPVAQAAVRGVIWYQGEANSSRADEYAALFKTLITSWRAALGQAEAPFYWVQLSAYKAGDARGENWPRLREAQTSALALPATGQAVAMDAGVSDHNDVHPRHKEPVGERLARLALAGTYQVKGVAAGGPVFAEARPFNRAGKPSLRVTFKPEGRELRQPFEQVAGFEVAGADKIFYPAEARLVGEAVIVSAAEVAEPVAVRYGWRNYTPIAVVDELGLPVAPFRSDDW